MGTPYKVATRPFLTESEARAAAAFLESEGIQCTLARNDPMGAAPVLGFSPGTQLLVSAEHQSRARELLGAVDSGALRALSESEYATESLKDNQPLSQEVIQVGLSRICRRRPDVMDNLPELTGRWYIRGPQPIRYAHDVFRVLLDGPLCTG